jgi:addiction module RelB/DinJ family antitoxin
VDAALKEDAESILTECGLNPAQAISLFYRQTVLRRALAFDVKIPNADSCKG